jgi:hypothetical protein
MIKQPETLRDVITRVMDTLNSRRQKMCDFFDDFDDFINDGFDDGEFDDDMESSADPDFNDELNQEDDKNDGFDVEDAFFTGGLFGFAYEEGKLKRRRRKNADSDNPSDID